MSKNFLPLSKKDMEKRGWPELDVTLITGDAYVDHPSYGIAVIARILEKAGYKVGIIAQPNWRSCDDFTKLGRPKLFFGVSSGNIDSMIANYSANKKPRKTDDYSPAGKTGLRPDRAIIVYSNKIREIYGKNIPVVLGGIEASLRRLVYYDYWDNALRRSILMDSRANILVYGMGERQIIEIASRLKNGENVNSLSDIRGTVIVKKEIANLKDYLNIPSYEEISKDIGKFNEAFKSMYNELNPYTAKTVIQKHYARFIIQLPPALPLTTPELDNIYELPYKKEAHPEYAAQGRIKGLETVKFSVISHRGCPGECSFCSLSFHQGRIIQSRSRESIIKEIQLISQRSDFKGTITDIGGPTANLYQANCPLWNKQGFCKNKNCILPSKCKNLTLGYKESIAMLREAKKINRVKHVFIGSGFRYDLLTEDYSNEYLREICRYHISGQMKVAPEHTSDEVLRIMNKPVFGVYEKFVRKISEINKDLKNKVFLVNYFISSHPGCTLENTLKLTLYLAARHIHPEQIQDFIPSPMTLSSCIYYTGSHPFTGKNIYIPRTFHERKMQRALIQHKNPKNRNLLVQALKQLNSMHLFKKLKTPGKRQIKPAVGV